MARKRRSRRAEPSATRLVEEALQTVMRDLKDDPRSAKAVQTGGRKAAEVARTLMRRKPGDCSGSICSFSCAVGCGAGCLIGGGTTIAFGALGGTIGGSGTAIAMGPVGKL